ncbi:MAG: hypothetical protein WD696_02605 [Bryobacteraceae bacterium]
MAEHTEHTDRPEVRHDMTDVNTKAVLKFVVGLVIALIVSAGLMLFLFDWFAARETRLSPQPLPIAAEGRMRVPPEPRLQADPPRDMREMRASEEDLLNSYGWVDRRAGVVRIPVDRAIEVMGRRGAK